MKTNSIHFYHHGKFCFSRECIDGENAAGQIAANIKLGWIHWQFTVYLFMLLLRRLGGWRNWNVRTCVVCGARRRKSNWGRKWKTIYKIGLLLLLFPRWRVYAYFSMNDKHFHVYAQKPSQSLIQYLSQNEFPTLFLQTSWNINEPSLSNPYHTYTTIMVSACTPCVRSVIGRVSTWRWYLDDDISMFVVGICGSSPVARVSCACPRFCVVGVWWWWVLVTSLPSQVLSIFILWQAIYAYYWLSCGFFYFCSTAA